MILVIGGGEMQLPLVEKAKKYGKVLLFDIYASSPGVKVADYWECVSTQDIHGAVRASRDWAKREKIEAVVSCGTDCSMTVSAVGVHHDCLVHPYAIAETLTRKEFMAGTLSAFMPPRDAGHGLILKPSDNMGGRGVTVVPVQMREHMGYAAREAIGHSPSGLAVQQAWVSGVEVSAMYYVENACPRLLSLAGRETAMGAKTQFDFVDEIPCAGFGYAADIGHSSWVDGLTGTQLRECDLVCRLAIARLGVINGPVKFDLKYDAKETRRPWILEACARWPGHFHATDTVLESTGFDVMDAYLKSSLGQPSLWPDYEPEKFLPGGTEYAVYEQVMPFVRVGASHPDAIRLTQHEGGKREPEYGAQSSGLLMVKARTPDEAKAKWERVASEVAGERVERRVVSCS